MGLQIEAYIAGAAERSSEDLLQLETANKESAETVHLNHQQELLQLQVWDCHRHGGPFLPLDSHHSCLVQSRLRVYSRLTSTTRSLASVATPLCTRGPCTCAPPGDHGVYLLILNPNNHGCRQIRAWSGRCWREIWRRCVPKTGTCSDAWTQPFLSWWHLQRRPTLPSSGSSRFMT